MITRKKFGANLSQPQAPAPTPDQLMFPEALSTPAATPAELPTEPDPTAWVAFGSYVHRATYLRLKQAEYYEPGFEIREFVEAALSEALAKLESAQKPLPVHVLEKLRRTNKKLG